MDDHDVLEALQFIDEKISLNDLILNDASHSSAYLLSFSVKNIVFYHWRDHYRTTEPKTIWENPTNPTLITSLLIKYHAKYIFVTSGWGRYSLTGVIMAFMKVNHIIQEPIMSYLKITHT